MAKQLARDEPGPVGGEGLYDRDLYTWCMEQAALLRAGRLDAVDLENVAEEIESLGMEQGDKLESAYRVLLVHLLKWHHQPERRTRSWLGSITRERANVARALRKNPGLKSRRSELFEDAYRDARKEAAAETGIALAVFPAECPFTMEQALDDSFLPGPEVERRLIRVGKRS
jgi:hypothetical protein